jgi:hypothetical protein
MQRKPHNSTATEVQRERILSALRICPTNTEELRALGIFQTTPRILELRRRGYDIRTELIEIYDRDGYPHRGVARYHLDGEPPPTSDEAPTVGAVQGFREKNKGIDCNSATARRHLQDGSQA